MSQIITLSGLKTHLNITDTTHDTNLTVVVNAANEYVEQITGRFWGGTESQTEKADYHHTIFLEKLRDINTITSVKVDGDTLAADEYDLDVDTGRLTIYGSGSQEYNLYDRNIVEVVAVVGVSTVPADLLLATLEIASRMWNDLGKGGKTITSKSVGSYRITYGSAGSALGGKDNEVARILDSYKIKGL